jgi:hypothetical protein
LLDRLEQFVQLERLLDLAAGAQVGRLPGEVPCPGEQEDRDVGQARVAPLLLPEAPAVHDRHQQVQQDQRGPAALA